MYRTDLSLRDRSGVIAAVAAIHAGIAFALLTMSGSIELIPDQRELAESERRLDAAQAELARLQNDQTLADTDRLMPPHVVGHDQALEAVAHAAAPEGAAGTRSGCSMTA